MDMYSEEFLRDQIEVQGKTGSIVAQENGLNTSKVYQKIKRYGIQNYREKLEAKVPDIIRLHKEGYLGREIAEKLNVNLSFVLKRVSHLSKNGRYADKLTFEFLQKHYIEMDMSPSELSKLIGCCTTTISTKVKEFGLTKNDSIKNTLTKELLYDLYINKNMSVKNIGNSFGLQYCETIRKLLVEYEIPIWEKGHRCTTQKESNEKRRQHSKLLGATLSKLRGGARSRNLPVEITINDIWERYLFQDKKCALSGVDVNFPENSKEMSDTTSFTASVDRIDSTKGYYPDNIQIVHKKLNVMKLDNADKTFIEWCCIVSDYQRSKH